MSVLQNDKALCHCVQTGGRMCSVPVNSAADKTGGSVYPNKGMIFSPYC